MSKHFLALLMEEHPTLSPEVQRLLLKPRAQLVSKDFPTFQKEVSPNLNKWTRALKKQYGKAGRPHDWALELTRTESLDLIDILMLDVVGRVAVFGEKPMTSMGYIAAAFRTLSWVSMAGIVLGFWKHENLWAAGAAMLTAVLMVSSRSFAVQDIYRRYRI